MNLRGNTRTVLVALALLCVSLALAACGDDNDEQGSRDVTTTVTTVEGEAAAGAPESEAAGNTANPEVSEEAADSDAATAIPGEETAVAGTEAEQSAETTTTTDPAATTTEQVDPATGEPLQEPTADEQVDPATGEPLQETTTTTTDASGGTTTTTVPVDPAEQPLPATTTPTTTVPAEPTPLPAGAPGGDPLIPASPVLGGARAEAILSRPFNSSSPWNTAVAGNPVDGRSDRWIRLSEVRVATVENAGADEAVLEEEILQDGTVVEGERTSEGARRERRRIDEGLAVNVTKWTVPVFSDRQEGAIQRIAVCRQFDCGPDAVTSVTIPADACPDPRYDGWMTAIDNETRTALDFWRGRCEADGSLSYHYVKRWDLDGPGFQEPLEVSARGSGLPLFAGLITPEEIRDGRIDHALAISVPGAAQRRYVQPASRTDGTGVRTSLPEGARIRLKPGATAELSDDFVRNKMQRSTANTIIEALERYGAIVVDRSAAPTLYAQRNADWTGILPLNLLQDIQLERFEVVEAGPILLDPPAAGEQGASAVVPQTAPGSLPGSAGGSQGEFSSPNFGVAP